MTDSDDFEKKVRDAGRSTAELKDSVSTVALEAAETGSELLADAEQDAKAAASGGDRPTPRVNDLRHQAAVVATAAPERVGAAYNQAAAVARTGYEANANRVVASPVSSVLLAGLAGMIVGWAWRGSVEADRRHDIIDGLPRYLRDRL